MERKERVRKSAKIDKKTDEVVKTYCAKNKISYNKAINDGLKLLTKTQMIEDNLPELLNTIERKIDDKLERPLNSMRRMIAKNSKSSLSAMYLCGEVLRAVFKEDEEYLTEMIKKADKRAYMVLKQGFLEGDITLLFNNIAEEGADIDE